LRKDGETEDQEHGAEEGDDDEVVQRRFINRKGQKAYEKATRYCANRTRRVIVLELAIGFVEIDGL
jgi:hypothetical protein